VANLLWSVIIWGLAVLLAASIGDATGAGVCLSDCTLLSGLSGS
jgi:hypothetical protein